MASLLERIKASSYNKKETVWPGTTEKIHLRVLNENDHLQSSLAADKIFKDTPIGVQNMDQYNAELETQYLFRAIEDPENGKQLFSNITDFRDQLSPEIKTQLAEELDAFHDEVSPNPYKISEEKFDKLVEDVKKNAEKTVGNVTSIDTLKRLSIYLAGRQKK